MPQIKVELTYILMVVRQWVMGAGMMLSQPSDSEYYDPLYGLICAAGARMFLTQLMQSLDNSHPDYKEVKELSDKALKLEGQYTAKFKLVPINSAISPLPAPTPPSNNHSAPRKQRERLTEEERAEIEEMILSEVRPTEIMKHYNITSTTYYNIRSVLIASGRLQA